MSVYHVGLSGARVEIFAFVAMLSVVAPAAAQTPTESQFAAFLYGEINSHFEARPW